MKRYILLGVAFQKIYISREERENKYQKTKVLL